METRCSQCGKVKAKDHCCDGMKDTPRVNSSLFRYGNKLDGDYKEEGIEPLFARGLEREIEALKADLKDTVDLLNVESQDSQSNGKRAEKAELRCAGLCWVLKNLKEQIQQVNDGDRPYTGFDTGMIDEALAQTEPLPAHPGCCDICDTGGCCKEESEEA